MLELTLRLTGTDPAPDPRGLSGLRYVHICRIAGTDPAPLNLDPKTLGKADDLDVFVTNASELRGLSNAQIAERLTIPNIPGGFKVIEFPSSAVNGIASPVFRKNTGFVQGGRTAGGASEFVVPNGPVPAGATQWIPK